MRRGCPYHQSFGYGDARNAGVSISLQHRLRLSSTRDLGTRLIASLCSLCRSLSVFPAKTSSPFLLAGWLAGGTFNVASTVEVPLTATSPQRPMFLADSPYLSEWLLFKPLYNGHFRLSQGAFEERFNCAFPWRFFLKMSWIPTVVVEEKIER